MTDEQEANTEVDLFFQKPILNSPYEYPERHWELNDDGQPTHNIQQKRRPASFITPVPKPKKRRKRQSNDAAQEEIVFSDEHGLSTAEQQYDTTGNINLIRQKVDAWRKLKDPNSWQVTPETARLLQHWRDHEFASLRPFFCQVEAVEVAIWLTEVAPKMGKEGRAILDLLEDANEGANPGLNRLALKLATGAGKTTVMAMLIAWQTINATRRPSSKRYTRGFLVIAPGITIRDRLRVLLPNDPDSYYKSRELVPAEMLGDLEKAKIVITNYHAFKLRETMDLSAGNRRLLQGHGEEIRTLETEGQMIQRVMPDLMGMKGIMVLNDEAHHCYREKPGEVAEDDIDDLKGEEKKDAKGRRDAARLWISGIEIVKKKLGVNRVFDLSATPFFLSGSGYAEGTLFPWTMSDFSLMDAIECGIVKLPRVPVADNLTGLKADDMPMFRNLWQHIGKKMPKKGRGQNASADPLALPPELCTALEALYGHYEKTYDLWQEEGISVPPCFIVVCNNTATSELVYKYISGFLRENEDGSSEPEQGRLKLFRNYDEYLNPLARPKTLLIDSAQLESGEALDKNFRAAAADEIDRFKRGIIARTGNRDAAENLKDEDILREVMNTVGKKGQLGESIRCVVSVSMLTEGWDANNVTHVLGVRAFGTQLLCEQVIGRALRRQSYDLNEEGRFNVEYADVLGIPFDFTAKPVVAPPQPPRDTIHVKAVRPERDALEIVYPRVEGYRVELPDQKVTARFTDDSTLELTPELIGPSINRNEGIIGDGVDLTLVHTGDMRQSALLFYLTHRLLERHWRDKDGQIKLSLFGQLKRVTREWLNNHLVCRGNTYPAQLMYQSLADEVCNRITTAINLENIGTNPVKAIVDSYNPSGTTSDVSFTTSKRDRWETSPDRCHINWAILDSDWEGEFCRVAESHTRVRCYAKNHSMGFNVPYLMGSEQRTYRPDYIVKVDDGHGEDDLLNLVVEIKGYRGEDAKVKKSTMETFWVPGVNNLKKYGRWAFAEFCDPYEMDADFDAKVESLFNTMIDEAGTPGLETATQGDA